MDVIVPVYNIAKYLPRFFDSMLNQSFYDFKLLVFDDGSDDNSLDICREYADKDSRICVFALEHCGVTNVRNTALEHIYCEFTVFADGDDYVEPDYLKNLIEAMDKTNADLVISNVIYNTEGSNRIDATFKKRGFQLLFRDDFRRALPSLLDDRRLNYLYAKIYRSEMLKDIKVDDNIKIGEDTIINLKYVVRANSIATIDNTDYHYIKYKTRSITSQYDKNSFENFCKINNSISDILKNADLLTDELVKVIDCRILQSAIWVMEKLISSNEPFAEKATQITNILNSEQYITSYNRQSDNIKDFSFDVIPPQSGKKYLKSVMRKNNSLKRRAKILSHCPDFIVQAYHKLKGNG